MHPRHVVLDRQVSVRRDSEDLTEAIRTGQTAGVGHRLPAPDPDHLLGLSQPHLIAPELLGEGALARDVPRHRQDAFDGSVIGPYGDRLDGERGAFADELVPAAFTLQGRTVVLQRHVEDLGRDLGTQIGHAPTDEQVVAQPGDPPNGLAPGEQHPQISIEEERRSVRQVGAERPVELLGASERCHGLFLLDLRGLALGDVQHHQVRAVSVGGCGPLQPTVGTRAGPKPILEPNRAGIVDLGEPGRLGRADIVRVDEGDERLGHQLISSPPERALPGGVQPRQAPVGGGDRQHLGRELEQLEGGVASRICASEFARRGRAVFRGDAVHGRSYRRCSTSSTLTRQQVKIDTGHHPPWRPSSHRRPAPSACP